MDISATDNTDREGSVFTGYAVVKSVSTIFTLRFRIVNGSVLIDVASYS